MSDTPRTDAETMRDEYDHVDAEFGPFAPSVTVGADFARQLEHELAEENTVSATLLTTKCRELAEVTKQLHHAVGLLSTTPQFENQHPEDIFIALKGGQP